jgi:hypothetical protein
MKAPAIIALGITLALFAAGLHWLDPDMFKPVVIPDREYVPPAAPVTPETYLLHYDAYDVSAEGYASYAEWMQDRPNNKMGIADPLPIAMEEIYKAPPPLPALQEYGIIQAPHAYPRRPYYADPLPWLPWGGRRNVASVPEPATWLMFGTGVIVCIALRYRRRHVK